MPTTCTSETKTNQSSSPLRRIYDNVSYPYLGIEVYVHGPEEDVRGFPEWLGRGGCVKAATPEQADLVVFAGGPDVDPKLYGDSRLPLSYVDEARDQDDLEMYKFCQLKGIPMLGICRGAQFLWVMMGGRLFQDVDGHNDGSHDIYFSPTRQKYRASSVHHQMCIPRTFDGLRTLAWATESTSRMAATHSAKGTTTDPEIYTVASRGIVGIQGHPEYTGFPNYSAICLDVVKEMIEGSPDIEVKGGYYRVKKVKG